MTDSPIEKLNMLNTEYAQMLANSSGNDLDIQFMRLGINPTQARNQLRFLALMKRQPETIEATQELIDAWEAVWGCKPTKEDIQFIPRLMWPCREPTEFDRSKVDLFLSGQDDKTRTKKEWEILAIAAGLTQKEIEAVFEYLDRVR